MSLMTSSELSTAPTSRRDSSSGVAGGPPSDYFNAPISPGTATTPGGGTMSASGLFPPASPAGILPGGPPRRTGSIVPNLSMAHTQSRLLGARTPSMRSSTNVATSAPNNRPLSYAPPVLKPDHNPSADVVPFLYQDFEDFRRSGKAPIREAAIESRPTSAHSSDRKHKGFFGKLKRKVREHGVGSSSSQAGSGGAGHVPLDAHGNIAGGSMVELDRVPSMESIAPTRSHTHLNLLGHGHGQEKDGHGHHGKDAGSRLGHVPSLTGIAQKGKKAMRQDSFVGVALPSTGVPPSSLRGGSGARVGSIVLDTDLSHLGGIVSINNNAGGSEKKGLLRRMTQHGSISDIDDTRSREASVAPGLGWSAPDSWGVVGPASETSTIAGGDSASTARIPTTIDEGKQAEPSKSRGGSVPDSRSIPGRKGSNNYFARVFKDDGTFSTVQCPLDSTGAEMMALLARKFFLTSTAGFQLLVVRNGISQVLGAKDKPMLLQKKLLEEVGYTDEDRIEELGREDNSYLCRFVFTTTTVPTFTPDEDSAVLGSFEHAQLAGKNLSTIPVALYRHASRIQSLDVSRNLSLDLPMDFVQACIALRELRFANNRAKAAPVAFKEAKETLTDLDLGSNRLEEVEHIGMEEFERIQTLKLHNNLLMELPMAWAGKLQGLKWLDISSNRLREFPKVVCELINLTDLDVSFNGMEFLPDEIGNLKNLERFVATNNKFVGALPPGFAGLTGLRELDIRFNALTNLDVVASLPMIEVLWASHNQVTQFENGFRRLKVLHLNKNPITKYALTAIPNAVAVGQSLTVLNLASAKLASFPDNLFESLHHLEKLVLDNNHVVSLPPEIGHLKRLTYFSCVNNLLAALPAEIGQLTELRFVDVHNNNLKQLPQEIWNLFALTTLNASSNLLDEFPIPPAPKQEKVGADGVAPPRKDSSASSRVVGTMAESLRELSLGDNRLTDDVFEQMSLLVELRRLNLSFNDIYEIPTGAIGRLQQLYELHLSGNELTSLPSDDLERMGTLRVLHVNGNKLQTLPAELGKIRRLLVLDVSNNTLKYNIANWPYDWNWNWNLDLKYLNLSGNKRLEIKPSAQSAHIASRERNLSDFNALTKLRCLGLMDVTLVTPSVPDQTEDRRVRTTGSEVANMSYGMADTLGWYEHLSIIDMVVPTFRGKENEVIFGMFDGHHMIQTDSGNKVSKYLQDSFTTTFTLELKKLRDTEGIPFALRRTFLTLNKDLGALVVPPLKEQQDIKPPRHLSASALPTPEDIRSGACATVVYIADKTMYVANVGTAMAVVSKSDGEAHLLTRKHEPGDAAEVERIRATGGYISRTGKVNDALEISRSFGHFEHITAVNAAPQVNEFQLTDNDEFVIVANKELWECMSYQTAVDIARTEREDLMLAAQKLRDFAIAYGAHGKITVMVIGVGDIFLQKKRRTRNASAFKNLPGGLATLEDDFVIGTKKRRGKEDNIEDSTLARLQREVPPPVGNVALVFTDIKNSTLLWETHPIAMRAAIKVHNAVMRRSLRSAGGYEVKTEGDAFMVTFAAVTSAMLWCFKVQTELMAADWPQEILDSEHGREVFDPETGQLLYRGLWVRMGIHYGAPVCEVDPITRRMDYFGPIVNRAARVSSVADGGQITVSSEIANVIHKFEDAETDGEIIMNDVGDEALVHKIRKEISSLKRLGFGLAPLGERKLKGLENPEFIHLIYPKSLAGRLELERKLNPQVAPPPKEELMFQSEQPRHVSPADVRSLGIIALRLEKICGAYFGQKTVGRDEATLKILAATMESKISEDVEDWKLVSYMANFLVRIENCMFNLFVRSLHPAGLSTMGLLPNDIFSMLSAAKEQIAQAAPQLDMDNLSEGMLGSFLAEGSAIDRASATPSSAAYSSDRTASVAFSDQTEFTPSPSVATASRRNSLVDFGSAPSPMSYAAPMPLAPPRRGSFMDAMAAAPPVSIVGSRRGSLMALQPDGFAPSTQPTPPPPQPFPTTAGRRQSLFANLGSELQPANGRRGSLLAFSETYSDEPADAFDLEDNVGPAAAAAAKAAPPNFTTYSGKPYNLGAVVGAPEPEQPPKPNAE
ncbi:cysteinyl-tRNA synthetase [Saitoella coloradoensis]